MAEIIPTRGAALALAEERRVAETGFEFLDEKRILLASTLLGELRAWQALRAEYDAGMAQAVDHLKTAVARHGLEGVQLYPAPEGRLLDANPEIRNFLGLGLAALSAPQWQLRPAPPAVDPSEAAEDCRAAFARLVPIAARIAVHARNIHRLIGEYRKTERRARALENVILPETVAELAAVTDYLDEADQEEAIRIRNAAR